LGSLEIAAVAKLVSRPPSITTVGYQHAGRLVMSNYMPPWLDQPSYVGPRHKIPRFGQILTIAAAVVLVSFFAALITAIVTAGGG
jgi:hypothetical protein